MHTIAITEVRGMSYPQGEPEPRETIVGLRAAITPPVDLNPEAVRNYIDAGNFDRRGDGLAPLQNPMLVGSTSEATIIRAGVVPGDEKTAQRELFGTRVSELLGFMGLETEVRQANSPDLK